MCKFTHQFTGTCEPEIAPTGVIRKHVRRTDIAIFKFNVILCVDIEIRTNFDVLVQSNLTHDMLIFFAKTYIGQ